MRRRPVLAALGTSIAGSVAGCLGAGEGYRTVPDGFTSPDAWQQFGYDARNTHAALGVEGPASDPALEWLHHDAREPSVLSSDDGVYLYAADGIPLSLDHDGEKQWEAPTQVTDSFPITALWESSMLATGRKLTTLSALDRADGTEQWTVELSGAAIGMPVTVLADTAYLITAAGVTAVNLADATEAWTADIYAAHPTDQAGPRFWSPAATPNHVFTINQDFAADTEPLYAIDRETGDIDWTLGIELEPQTRISGPPVVGDEFVFVVAGLVSEGPEGESDHSSWTRIVAIDPDAEDIAWEKTLEGRANYGTAVTAERLYLAYGIGGSEESGQLSALDTADGSIEWTEEIDWMSIPLTVTEEHVYGHDGFRFRAFDRDDGTPAWDLDLQDTVAGNDAIEAGWGPYWPVIHNGTWYIFVGENTLAAIR